jgi:hypothetical protein
MAIHIFISEADGFFLNLTTELIGILITVFYVEWIIRRHENQRWLSTDERVIKRMRILLNSTITGLRSGLNFGVDVLDEQVGYSLDEYAMHKDIMRVGEHIIKPAVLSRVRALDQAGWAKLAQQIQNSHNSVISFLNLFQNRLRPDQISDLLDLQEFLNNSLTCYSVFPDILGVPEDKLPKTKTPPEELQQFCCEATAKDIRNVCSIVKKLSEYTSK